MYTNLLIQYAHYCHQTNSFYKRSVNILRNQNNLIYVKALSVMKHLQRTGSKTQTLCRVMIYLRYCGQVRRGNGTL